MNQPRLDEINAGSKPTGRETRLITYEMGAESWEHKSARHRAYCQKRRYHNRIARASRQANRRN